MYLTRLKNQVNLRTDPHDLEGLAYGDVDDAGIRDEILSHIAEQARDVVTGQTKVLSDIDDTVFCALHDRRWPRGIVYPGALALVDALDAGPTPEPFSTGDLTFVTARPGDFLGLIGNHTRTALRKAGVATVSVLTGTLPGLFGVDAVASAKAVNIRHYHALFPEYRLLFVGDSGQRDVTVGERLHEEFGDHLDLVLIHDVVDTPPELRAEHAARGVAFFDTYAGAAQLAHRAGLISDAGRDRVFAEVIEGLDAVPWASDAQERAMRELVERDLAGE